MLLSQRPIICPIEQKRQMGPAMSEALALPPTAIDRPVSIARLHGEACFHCGAVSKTLHAAGHITLAGGTRVWPVVTCGCQAGASQ